MLWLYQRVFYGEGRRRSAHHMPDLNAREWAAMRDSADRHDGVDGRLHADVPAAGEKDHRARLDQTQA
jgi:hypothetical protein